jgi:Putative prokaryotic signal transducing protein
VGRDRSEVGGHCPRCGAEYRPGVELCADDGTPLLPGPLPEPGKAPAAARAPRNWRQVAALGREEEARLLAGRLEAEGIDARLFPEPTFSLYGRDTVPMLGQPIRVLVPEEAVDEAAGIIEEIRRTP